MNYKSAFFHILTFLFFFLLLFGYLKYTQRANVMDIKSSYNKALIAIQQNQRQYIEAITLQTIDEYAKTVEFRNIILNIINTKNSDSIVNKDENNKSQSNEARKIEEQIGKRVLQKTQRQEDSQLQAKKQDLQAKKQSEIKDDESVLQAQNNKNNPSQSTKTRQESQQEGGEKSIDNGIIKKNPQNSVILTNTDTLATNSQSSTSLQSSLSLSNHLSDKNNSTRQNSKKIQLIYFFDYNCPFCRDMHNSIHVLRTKFRNLEVLYREIPALGEKSLLITKYSLAVKISQPYKYHSVRKAFLNLKDGSNLEEIFGALKACGIDPLALQAFIDQEANSKEIKRILEQHIQHATRMQIDGTPSIVINGNILSGKRSFVDLENLILSIMYNQHPHYHSENDNKSNERNNERDKVYASKNEIKKEQDILNPPKKIEDDKEKITHTIPKVAVIEPETMKENSIVHTAPTTAVNKNKTQNSKSNTHTNSAHKNDKKDTGTTNRNETDSKNTRRSAKEAAMEKFAKEYDQDTQSQSTLKNRNQGIEAKKQEQGQEQQKQEQEVSPENNKTAKIDQLTHTNTGSRNDSIMIISPAIQP